MAMRTGILAKADELDLTIRNYDGAVRDWQRKLKQGKRGLRQNRVSFVTSILLALLLTSSCSMHAWQMLGGPNMEVLAERWEALLDAPGAQVAALNETLGFLVTLVVRLIGFPIGLCTFVLSMPLHMLEGIFEMTFPPALKVQPFVELAIVAIAVVLAVITAIGKAQDRAAHAQIREARERLQSLRANEAQIREARTELASIKASEAYRRAEDEYKKDYEREVADNVARERRLAEERRVDEEYRREKIARYRKQMEAFVPAGVPMSSLEPYLEEDAEKAALFAELVKRQADRQGDSSSLHKMLGSPRRYLDFFEQYFKQAKVSEMKDVLASIDSNRQIEEYLKRSTEIDRQLLEAIEDLQSHIAQEAQEVAGDTEATEEARPRGKHMRH